MNPPDSSADNASLALRFMGVGNAHAAELGCSSCVLERNQEPLLLIDCGSDTLHAFSWAYARQLPMALFITHTHLDHIGGLENLFYRAYFDERYCGRIRLYVPVPIIQALHQRLGAFPGILAEGGANFWDCFQMIPVSDRFWHGGLEFTVFPVRHHMHMSAFGLSLPGAFLFTGDTRPIPEVINTYARRGELIFHDAGLEANPSHTGIREIPDNYSTEQIARMIFHHYESERAARCIEQLGYHVARRHAPITLRGTASEPPLAAATDEPKPPPPTLRSA